MQVRLKIYRKKTGLNRKGLLFFLFCLTAAYSYLCTIPKGSLFSSEKEAVPVELPPVKPEPPPLKEKSIIIPDGVTLSDILSENGFSPIEIHNIRQQVKPVYDLASIKSGHKFRFLTNSQDKIAAMEYDIDSETYLRIEPGEEEYTARIENFPIEIRTAVIWGVIRDNLISALAEQGEKDPPAVMLEEIFGWDIDFYTDLRQGDSFKIFLEKKYLEGEFIGYGSILAAEFTNQGNTFRAFRYAYPDNGKWDYFTFSGDSLRKEFLKSPIAGARITSRFTSRRLHPIRKIYRPHYGVDYAANVGTKVRATADGTVIFTGWNGASGRMIRIRHKNQYETMYLHLKGYAGGIKKGAAIKSGDTIGYVGVSGESSGPHLDYRIKHRGRYINPLAYRFQPVKPLRKEFLPDFRSQALYFRLSLDAPRILYAVFGNPMRPPLAAEPDTQYGH